MAGVYWFLPQLEKLIGMGMGGGQAYSFLLGMTKFNKVNFPGFNDTLIRKTEFLSIVRNMKGAASAAEVLQKTPKGRATPFVTLPTTDYNISTNRWYRYKVDIIDPITGERVTTYRSLMVDEELLPYKAEQAMIDKMKISSDMQEDEILSLTLDAAYKKNPYK